MQLTIKAKFLLLGAALSVVLALAAAATTVSMGELRPGGATLARLLAAKDFAADGAAPALSVVEAYAVATRLQDQDAPDRAAAGERLRRLAAAFRAAAARWRGTPDGGHPDFVAVVATGEAFHKIVQDELLPASAAGDLARVAQVVRVELQPMQAQQERALRTVAGAAAGRSVLAAAEVDAVAGGRPLILIGVFAGAALLVLGACWWMSNVMLRPIREVQDVLVRLSKRELTARMTGEYQAEFAAMRTAVNAVAQTLHDDILQVATAVLDAGTQLTGIALSSHEVASGASQQASALEETAASIEEMSVMTKQNVANAMEANTLAQQARESTSAGAQAMQQMTDAMTRILQAAQATAAIINDINEISFQTNLLALNAAVEGARAGEAGRGFAVVAEEVRTLALRSKDAARNTENLIRESMELSAHGQEIARQVARSLDEIDGHVGKLTSIVGDIAGASEEQARGIEHLNKAVAAIDQVTQSNVTSAESSASASVAMATQSAELGKLIGTFKIDRTFGDAGGVESGNLFAAAFGGAAHGDAAGLGGG